MKKNILSLILIFAVSIASFAQVDTVTIRDIQFVSQTDLQNCNDTSAYFGKTVYVVAVVGIDGGLSEVASGSVAGGNRPFTTILDTANGGMGGDYHGCDLMSAVTDPGTGSLTAYPGYENWIAGDIIGMECMIGRYQGETQLTPTSNTAITLLGSMNVPEPVIINLGDLNDDSRENQLETGEEYEGSIVTIENVTVTAVNFFSGGSRVSMDVTDANGNIINVSDRYLAQKLSSHQTVNAGSPATTGSFVAPPVGTQYKSITGVIIHSENGCTGNATGRGYEIDPFLSEHYKIGLAPPNFSNIDRTPFLPKSSESTVVSATITDFDGAVTSADLYYSDDVSAPLANFTKVAMTLVGGSTDEFEATIPAFAEGTTVRYIITADDDSSNQSVTPFTPGSSTDLNVYYYTVRDGNPTIMDVQRTFGTSDLSSFNGEEVTVTGYVTASTDANDIGYVYIQDGSAAEYAGINVPSGSLDLLSLCRGEEVTITGTVEENFGHTRITGVSNVVKTGNWMDIMPVEVDPAMGATEAHESMLISYKDPGGSNLSITDADAGFGEYEVGTSAGSSRVLAGRQSSSSFASLYVSLITDTFYVNNDGSMEVTATVTDTTMTMSEIRGMLYYSFGAYKLLPRNNSDIVGFSGMLDDSQEAPCFADTSESGSFVNGINNKSELAVYPNPSNGQISIHSFGADKVYQLSVFDLSGKEVFTRVSLNEMITVNLSFLNEGSYILKLNNQEGSQIGVQKLIIQ